MPLKWILVVDDDPHMLAILSEFLDADGVRVTTAADAMQCFIQARDLKPALVICDINMPKHTGDAALRELRKDPRLNGIPFIFITGMPLDKVRPHLPAGDPSVRLMAKPLDLPTLKTWIKEMTGIELRAAD